jgi:class 3 adenylate cyclase
MPSSAMRSESNNQTRSRAAAVVAVVVLAPLALLALLRARPALDAIWENHPAHFWLVLAASAIATVLGYAVATASRRRQDARLFVISLGFISGAGFLGLHALATPGVLVGPNAGFELATPIGLVLGGVFVALSTIDFSPRASRRIMARSTQYLAALVVLMLAWAVVSIAELPPLNNPLQQEALQGWQVVLAVLGIAGYTAGSLGYLRLYRRRGARFVLAVALAFALLAAAMVVIAFAVNWRISWWEWHVLMLAAFGLMAAAAREEWHEERFSALYLEQTLAGAREVSVLFADLQGFTPYSERTPPQGVKRMLDAYFARLVPLMEEQGGEVHQLIGDAVMVVFNKQGDHPEHALLAARAGLAFQDAAADIARTEPDWPRFRVGLNSGEVVAGVLGERGHRKHGVIGDTVNLAARLEGQAPVGEVVIGEGTYNRLPEGTLVEPLPPLVLKGKSEPVTGYILRAVPA